jgi:hypothetical protein
LCSSKLAHLGLGYFATEYSWDDVDHYGTKLTNQIFIIISSPTIKPFSAKSVLLIAYFVMSLLKKIVFIFINAFLSDQWKLITGDNNEFFH